MKFGKLYEDNYQSIGLDLPPFPYRAAKKKLKALQREANPNASPVFLSDLEKRTRTIDHLWKRAVWGVIRNAVAPRKAAVLTRIGLARPTTSEDAARLDAWARLSREAMRKILKKANKQLGTAVGLDTLPGEPFAFVCSRTRTELEYLAARVNDGTETTHDCPVCLDLLFQPVAPACGHAICAACFQNLKSTALSPCCPICRGPANAPQRMHVAAAAAKAADPARHTQRKEAEEYEKAVALAKKYERRIRTMPLQQWQ